MTSFARLGVFLGALTLGAGVTGGALVLSGVVAGDTGRTGVARPTPMATSPVPAPASTAPGSTMSPTGTPGVPSPSAAAPPPSPSRALVDYTFPIADCPVDYAATHHHYPATDIWAAPGCVFVAPVAGTVDEVGLRDTWDPTSNDGAARGGLFVSVVGVDGVRYYGSHLSSVAEGIRPGVEVDSGTPLGGVGETGSARGTGSHLHFGISWPTAADRWWVRRGMVSPATFLDAWRGGRSGPEASPVEAVREARAAAGDTSRCREYC